MRELVSAVIPTYNYGHYIVQAVESALAQTWPDLEVVVVDDGSRDDTRPRLEPYLGRIRYIYQENRGLSAARNTGIRAAKGEWIALLDSDDWWHPEKTEIQLAAAQAGGFDAIGSPACAPTLPDHLPTDPVVRRLEVLDCLRSPPVTGSSTMIRRRCFEEVGYFDEELQACEDRDMWLRLVVRFPMGQVASPCWVVRSHGGQMSSQAERMFHSYRAVLEKFFREHPQPATTERLGWAFMYMTSAITYLEEGKRQEARQLLLQSVGRWPLSLRGQRSKLRFRRAKLLTRATLGDSWMKQAKRLMGALGLATKRSF